MSDRGLRLVLQNLTDTLVRDTLVQQTTHDLRDALNVDRVVLYYFYYPWKGQVTFESLSQQKFSIVGSSGPDECFNGDYAALYEAGRVRAIEDIEAELIDPCHRDYLRSLQVKANLVVPVLNPQGLWGLLIAHHCQATRAWSKRDIERVRQGAKTLETVPAIQNRS
ncbi:MAG: GAF domain-containing protein [Desertifilum sp.]|nr:GAF domain-containing protein [Desertifilum sp.]